MATMELDPVFVRALRLLHSKSKDSSAQLRTMLDEAIRHRKGLGPCPTGLMPHHGLQPASPQQHGKGRDGSSSSSSGKGDHARREAEKRSLDRLKHELSELVPSKRPRLDSPRSSSAGLSSKSHTPSPTPPGSRGEMIESSGRSGGSGDNTSEAGDDGGIEGAAFDIADALNDLDCMCCVCRSLHQENGNKLMECHTCTELYHQSCHAPPVSNEEANDPRLVWNCTNCTMKQVI